MYKYFRNFCPKHGQGFKLSAAHLHPNISRVPPGVTTLSLNNTVFALTFSTLHWQDKMTSRQALLVKLAKLVKELLQKLPYWWKLPIVLMMFYQFRQRDYLLNNNLFDAYSSQLTGPKYDCQDPLIGKYYYIKHNFTQEVDWGARDGAVVRALASYQCGFKPRRRRNMWVAFVVGSLPCSEKFFSGYSSFPLFSKPTFPNSNSTRNQVGEEPLCGCASSKSLLIIYLFIYSFIYLNEKILIHIIT